MPIAGVWRSLGWILLLFAAALCLPVLVAVTGGEARVAGAFLPAAIIAAFTGALLVLSMDAGDRVGPARRGATLALLSLVSLSVIAALPFRLSGVSDNFLDAWFEAVSGLTTTGATLIADPGTLPDAIVFWRALLEWLGGFGAIVMLVTYIVPLFFPGMMIFTLPLPPNRSETAGVRLTRVAEMVWPLYVSATLVGWAALWAAGLDSFESLCLAMSAISTGGFSPRAGSLADFGNPYVGPIVALLVLFGALNFLLHVQALTSRRLPHLRDSETHFVLAGAIGSAAVFGLAVTRDDLYGLPALLLDGFLLALGSGFTVGSDQLVALVPPVVVITVALVGGAMTSTAGGVKMIRVMTLVRLSAQELARLSHPQRAHAARLGGREIEPRLAGSVWSYFFMVLVILAGFLLLLTAMGLGFEIGLAGIISTLSNTGVPLVYVGGEGVYATLGEGVKWLMCLGMIIGRVDVLAVLAVLNPAFWNR